MGGRYKVFLRMEYKSGDSMGLFKLEKGLFLRFPVEVIDRGFYGS